MTTSKTAPTVCPRETLPETLDCPRGCGYQVLAKPVTAQGVWNAGPWRMQVHNRVAEIFGRCPVPPMVGKGQR
ncbi:Uncharacterised protein [Mycobacteroides abscessus subsp. abscessus]|uniref:hypothetical protein n=1 Tax=Mycobacteroides abscessus TaxID=36809 RepID=UPI000928D187|nr:hypothetical protein [Mycobacteroides abscessus]SHW33315.1 Uncharacterised protein [Mycobacteroides abscessus subsp. abscessus]SHW52462.1 Uncharacterised protein [Mycobacteroides abscessus subsp. abscessus]SIC47087.1 Uncharacterised protein [Mycobacteroides abscessus subsp. abscessus]SKV57087.1 Uncharacterised protein [Mycobacteroides abscessus subsp. abscessus]